MHYFDIRKECLFKQEWIIHQLVKDNKAFRIIYMNDIISYEQFYIL